MVVEGYAIGLVSLYIGCSAGVLIIGCYAIGLVSLYIG